MMEITFFERMSDGQDIIHHTALMPAVPRINDHVTLPVKSTLVRCRVVDVDWLPPGDGDTATSASVQIVQKYEPDMEPHP